MEHFIDLLRLAFGQDSFATECIKILERMMPHELAKAFYARYNKHDYSNLKQEFPKLSDLCINMIKKNDTVDILFGIYGPDTNFPIPNHLVARIHKKNYLGYDQSLKLALLLVNNNLTTCRTRVCNLREDCVVGKWEPLLWQKLASVASDNLTKYKDTTDYTTDFEDTFNLIEIALPFLDKFKNLQSLTMSQTSFHDEHLLQLVRSAPNLKRLFFQINGKISNIGLNALTRFKKLEELLYDFNGEIYDCEDMLELRDLFATNCLGAMPKLKIVGYKATDSVNLLEHAVPEFDQPTELALEHMKIMRKLKKMCKNSSLPNVRFLDIHYMEKTGRTVQNILDLGMTKLEYLCFEECSAKPATLLVSGLGRSLTTLSLDCDEGGIDFFEIINFCPSLKKLDLCNSGGGKCFYKFSSNNRIREIPKHLERVSLNLRNPLDVVPPPGPIVRLFQAPKLRDIYINNLYLAEEDCLSVVEKLQAGACGMLEFFSFIYDNNLSHDAVPILLCAIATYCPNIKSVRCCGQFICRKPLVEICSAMVNHCKFNLN